MARNTASVCWTCVLCSEPCFTKKCSEIKYSYRIWSITNWKRCRVSSWKIRNRFLTHWSAAAESARSHCAPTAVEQMLLFIFFFSITDFYTTFCNPRFYQRVQSHIGRMMSLKHASTDMQNHRMLTSPVWNLPSPFYHMQIENRWICKQQTTKCEMCVFVHEIGTWPSLRQRETKTRKIKFE